MIWFFNTFNSNDVHMLRNMKVGNETYFWNWLITNESTHNNTLSQYYSALFLSLALSAHVRARMCLYVFQYFFLPTIGNFSLNFAYIWKQNVYWTNTPNNWTWKNLIWSFDDIEILKLWVQSNNKWAIFMLMMIMILNENTKSFHRGKNGDSPLQIQIQLVFNLNLKALWNFFDTEIESFIF